MVAQQLFTIVKRENAIAITKKENGSSIHGEPFFLRLPRGEKEKDEKSENKNINSSSPKVTLRGIRKLKKYKIWK